MAEYKCRQRQPVRGAAPPPECAPMECAPMPMNRYISPCPPTSLAPDCGYPCQGRESRILLEQLVELSVNQSQVLVDILGAINALTAALLTVRAQV